MCALDSSPYALKFIFYLNFFKVDIWLSRQEKDYLLLVLKVGPEYIATLIGLKYAFECRGFKSFVLTPGAEKAQIRFSFQLIIYGL